MAIIRISSPAMIGGIPTVSALDDRPLYICAAGQTGAGKSTILHSLTDLVAEYRENIVVLDEKALHHPYLDQLFLFPDRYAFELQLQFMINRVLFVKRWLASGYSVVMERSHAEDPVFVRHLLAFNYLTQEEHDVYMSVWATLSKRLPWPDFLVFLDVPAEVSIQRLSQAEANSERPAFPDETARRAWIASWHHLYRERFKELQSEDQAARVIRFSFPVCAEEFRETMARALTNLLQSDPP